MVLIQLEFDVNVIDQELEADDGAQEFLQR
jgi:hypothetical protein